MGLPVRPGPDLPMQNAVQRSWQWEIKLDAVLVRGEERRSIGN